MPSCIASSSMPDSRGIRAWLVGAWYRPSPPLALLPLSLLYRLVIALRRICYRCGLLRSDHPGVPVIVVGNLAVGGTGKTPLVMWLVSQLRTAGLRPGVVLRGYRASIRTPRLVEPGDSAALCGDEALLIAQRTGCPVATGVDRVAASRLLVQAGCNLVIADDGLQHLALRRDLQIVVVDGARGFGNGALLPAGPLREPVSRLAAADLVVVNGADLQGVSRRVAGAIGMELQPQEPRALVAGVAQSLAQLREAPVHAVAGTGNPQRFFDLLRSLGITLIEHPFPDHHAFTAGDLAFGDDRLIVMTEKDAVKCRTFATGRMVCLPVLVHLPPEAANALIDRIRGLFVNEGDSRRA